MRDFNHPRGSFVSHLRHIMTDSVTIQGGVPLLQEGSTSALQASPPRDVTVVANYPCG